MAASASQELTYATDEQKSGYVRVILPVKGLKTTKKLVKVLKFEKIADNANITHKFDNRGFQFKVEGTKSLKEKMFHLNILQLPGDIIPDECYYEVETDRILLFLCKRESESWYPELENGLETSECSEGGSESTSPPQPQLCDQLHT